MRFKPSSLIGSIQKSSSDPDATFVLSTSDVDRDNDIISVSALKGAVSGVKKLITLWQHKYDQPIGFWENLRVEGKRLLGDLKVSSTNLGNLVKQLLSDGVPLASSIGFMGQGEWNEKRSGIDFSAIELLECSVVSVPANPNAQRILKAYQKKFGSPSLDLTSIVGVDSTSQSIRDNTPAVSAAIMKAHSALALAQMTVRK